MKTLETLLTVIGLLTLISCTQDRDVNSMMHQNEGYHYWGMHTGWWIFILLILIILIVFFSKYTKRK